MKLARFMLDQKEHSIECFFVNPEHVGTVIATNFTDIPTIITTRDGVKWYVRDRIDAVLDALRYHEN